MNTRLAGGALLTIVSCLPQGDDLGAYSAEWSPASGAGVAAVGGSASGAAAGTNGGSSDAGSGGVVGGGSLPLEADGGAGTPAATAGAGGAPAAGTGGSGGGVPVMLPEPDGPCEEGVIGPDADRCYLVSSRVATWQDARNVCTTLDSTLVKVESAQEDAFLDTLLAVNQWLGGSDTVVENAFVWTDGTTMAGFGNWGLNQPDRYPGPDCVEKRDTAGRQWFDQPCDNLRAFVCERPIDPDAL